MAGRVPTLTQAPGETPIAGKYYVATPWLQFFNRLLARNATLITIPTGAPTLTVNGTGEFWLDGLTPETLYLRVRRGGVDTDVPIFTFP